MIEDIDFHFEGEVGENGRPRVREPVKVPPEYENIDLCDPDADVLFQGELLKYKAGYTPTFISRWVQVTENSMKYYKNRCLAITCSTKPLMAVPIKAIKKVERVNFELPFSATEKAKNQVPLQNQFEIIFKDDFLELFVSPDYDTHLQNQQHSHQNLQSQMIGSD